VRKGILLILIVFIGSMRLYAQEDTARELAMLLSSGEDMDGVYKQAGNAFANRLEPNVKSRILRELTKEEKERFAHFWYTKMLEIMPIVSVEDAMVKILNENLTNAEMQEMIVFYTSPVGIKLIELAPTFRAEKQKAAEELGRAATQKGNLEKIETELKNAFPEWFGRPGT